MVPTPDREAERLIGPFVDFAVMTGIEVSRSGMWQPFGIPR